MRSTIAPALIVGDFNSPSHGIAPTALKENGLMNMSGELYPDANQTHKSWDFRFHNGSRATWPIDSCLPFTSLLCQVRLTSAMQGI